MKLDNMQSSRRLEARELDAVTGGFSSGTGEWFSGSGSPSGSNINSSSNSTSTRGGEISEGNATEGRLM